MMKMNKKAFSLVELLAVIAIIALVTTIGFVAYSSYYDNAEKKIYENYESGMKEGAIIYIMDTGEMPTSSQKLRLTLKYLVGEMDNGHQATKPYIDYFKNPKDANDKCTDHSYVEIELVNKEEASDNKIDYNKKFNYKVCLICNNYKTDDC